MNSLTDPAVPDVVLERYRLGELPPAEIERLARQLEDDTDLRGRLEAIEASDLEMVRAGVPDLLSARVRVRAALLPAERSTRSWPAPARWLVPAAVAGAAIAVLVISFPGERARFGLSTSSTSDQVERDVRVKGLKPSLTLFRKTPAGTERLEPASRLRSGDLVRVAYQAAGRPYGVILSIDGRASVTLHLPASGQVSARLLSGDRVLLEQAYELDEAPRWEKFYLITGQTPFDVAAILDAARRAAAAAGAAGPSALVVAPELEQASVLFLKEGKP